jgi:hypothetical protein
MQSKPDLENAEKLTLKESKKNIARMEPMKPMEPIKHITTSDVCK